MRKAHDTQPTRAWSARRLFFVLVPGLVLGAFGFKLFEPVLVYNSGWEPLPSGPYTSVSMHAPDWSEVAGEADRWLIGLQTELTAPAVSAAVSVDGERVWAGAVGYSDLETRAGVTLDTAFRIGSSSKAVTSVAMGVLLQDDAVDLDAPVSTYVPDLSGSLGQITSRQAMSHTAGVRGYGLCWCFPIWEYYNRRHYSSQREALRPFEASGLLFSPGQGFSYSSYGYNIAGAVIEGVTKLGFDEFLQRSVFDPLGMKTTHVETGEPMSSDATFYEVENRRYKETFRVDNTNKLPSGGVVATPSDMTRLGQQMIVPTLFSQETRNLLVRHQPLADGRPNPQGYALGWRHHEATFLKGAVTTPRYHHHGVAYGAVSHFSVYPEYGIVVSVMTNKNSESLGERVDPLTDLFVSVVHAGSRSEAKHGSPP